MIKVDVWANGPVAAVRPHRGQLTVEEHVERVAGLGVQAVSLWGAGLIAGRGWSWLWPDLEAMRRVVLAHQAAGRRVTITDWVGASPSDVKRHLDQLELLLRAGVWPDRIEHDAEEDVTNDSAAQASDAPRLLEEGYRRLEELFGRAMPTVVVTGTPGAPSDVRRYGAWERAKIWRGQWYSFRRPASQGPHWSHRAKGPVHMQRWGAQVAQGLVKAGLFDQVEAGLAWYWQRELPGYDGDVEEALTDAAREAAQHTGELCGWALTHLLKPGAEARTCRAFVQRLSRGLVELDHPQDEEPGAGARLIEQLQWLLVSQGYELGSAGPGRDGVDGRWGPRTEAAAQAAEGALGLRVDGRPDLELLRALSHRYQEVMGRSPDYNSPPRSMLAA